MKILRVIGLLLVLNLNGYLINYWCGDTGVVEDDSSITSILVITLLGPIFETLIFNHLIFIIWKTLNFFIKAKDILYIGISALVFSLFHPIGNCSFLFFIAGFIFASVYYFSSTFRFWKTAALHCLANAVALILNVFLLV